jgi:hypothetical protein
VIDETFTVGGVAFKRTASRAALCVRCNKSFDVHSYNKRALDMHATKCATESRRLATIAARVVEREQWSGPFSHTVTFDSREVTVTFEKVMASVRRGCQCSCCGQILAFATEGVCEKHIKAKHEPLESIAEKAAAKAREAAAKTGIDAAGRGGQMVMDSFFARSKEVGADQLKVSAHVCTNYIVSIMLLSISVVVKV